MAPAFDAHRAVVIGGGFAGLAASRVLGRAGVRTVLVDRRNFHLFQPLLYQVATGVLPTSEIATTLRTVFARHPSVRVLEEEVLAINPQQRTVRLREQVLPYDSLVLAAGGTNHYFGHPEWERYAPSLKTAEDALEIRRRIFEAFEAAERVADREHCRDCLNFAIVGGGPTGVEMAGALAELARSTLPGEYRAIDPRRARIYLFEGGDRILESFHPEHSRYAERVLRRLGVTVTVNALVTAVDERGVTYRVGGIEERLGARTVIWAAGVRGVPLAPTLAAAAGLELDRNGRVPVGAYLSVPGHDEIFVVGDLAHAAGPDGAPLPGLAPVAMQQGAYAGEAIVTRLRGRNPEPFHYRDRGEMAVIGRGRAVARIFGLRLQGFGAWVIWAVVHVFSLVEIDNRLIVFFRWAWNYLTNTHGARVITKPWRAASVDGEKSPRNTDAIGYKARGLPSGTAGAGRA